MNTSQDPLSKLNRTFRVDGRYVYENWPGNNAFFFKGKLVAGPGYFKGILTIFYGLLYSINCMITSFKMHISLFLIDLSMTLITLFFETRAVFSDPGVLQRSYCILPKTLKQRTLVLKGRLFRFKYCKTCCIFRPLGTSHCHECNNCVERYDHHCPWIGNCVGRNNYKYFFLFLTSYNLLLLFNLIVGSVAFNRELKNYKSDFKEMMSNEPYSFIQLFLTFGTMSFVTSLYCYHIKLITNNYTTYVRVKQLELIDIFGNPYDRYGINLKRGSSLKNISAAMRMLQRMNFSSLVDDNPPEVSIMRIQTLHHKKIVKTKSDKLLSNSSVTRVEVRMLTNKENIKMHINNLVHNNVADALTKTRKKVSNFFSTNSF